MTQTRITAPAHPAPGGDDPGGDDPGGDGVEIGGYGVLDG